jgi:prophage regulatory protein
MTGITKLNQNLEKLLRNDIEKPLTVEEAANYLRLKKSYLYKLTWLGKIPYFQPGGKIIYFLKSDLNAYLLQNRQPTEKEMNQKELAEAS